jgi:hypothetical protein
MLFNSIFVILFFILILAFGGIISYRVETHNHYQNSRVNTFITIISGLGIFMTFLFYYNLVELQKIQQQNSYVHDIVTINNQIIDNFYKEISNSSNKIPNFIESLNPLYNKNEFPAMDEDTLVNRIEKNNLSFRIFTIWESFIICDNLLNYDQESYIRNFLQKANSRMLFDEWKKLKINFSKRTQIFGDLLFEYGLSIRNNNLQIYEILSKEILEDERYKNILVNHNF